MRGRVWQRWAQCMRHRLRLVTSFAMGGNGTCSRHTSVAHDGVCLACRHRWWAVCPEVAAIRHRRIRWVTCSFSPAPAPRRQVRAHYCACTHVCGHARLRVGWAALRHGHGLLACASRQDAEPPEALLVHGQAPVQLRMRRCGCIFLPPAIPGELYLPDARYNAFPAWLN